MKLALATFIVLALLSAAVGALPAGPALAQGAPPAPTDAGGGAEAGAGARPMESPAPPPAPPPLPEGPIVAQGAPPPRGGGAGPIGAGAAPAGGVDVPGVSDEPGGGISKPVAALIALAALSLAPFVLVMTTSFLKFSVVGSILRSALGTQQIPPNQVITGLAMILTVYVMAPTGSLVYREVEGVAGQAAKDGVFSDESIDLLKTAVQRGKEPYLDFLYKHSHAKDRQLFLWMAKALRTKNGQTDAADELTERDPLILVTAFVTSELKEAFQIGFIIFVPFLVIDMIVSNILLAMGMQMLSPQTIALPLKLLLFVLVDGWHLLMKGLVLGYL